MGAQNLIEAPTPPICHPSEADLSRLSRLSRLPRLPRRAVGRAVGRAVEGSAPTSRPG